MDRFYSATPDGYCGDEDNGQTSAWYVFSALGFYPVCPGSDQYVLGAPLFKKAVIHLENGKTFEIKAPENSDTNYYIQQIKLMGRQYPYNYLIHSDIWKGGIMEVKMSDHPNEKWGTKSQHRPYSFSNEKR
jgi:putative alpha-1,2-mannosidase